MRRTEKRQHIPTFPLHIYCSGICRTNPSWPCGVLKAIEGVTWMMKDRMEKPVSKKEQERRIFVRRAALGMERFFQKKGQTPTPFR